MKRSRRNLLGAAIVGLSLVATACGGSGGEEGATGTTSVTLPQNVTATTAKPPASMDEWKTLNTKERDATVKKIVDGKFGKAADGKSVVGAEGFKIDLSKCPATWSDTEGLSDTEIKIGHTTALSGTLADYGNIGKTMQMYADDAFPNGIKDSAGKTRKIKMIIKDDGYDANRTIPLVDELIDSEKVFMVITLGSPATMKTYDKLNQRCVPQPHSQTGHPAWGDPVNHPWTTGLQLAYNTEAVFWGNYIDNNFDKLATGGKVTVAALIMNNDFGKAYSAAFKDYLATSKNKANITFVSETIEPTAPTITDPMTTLASKNPDVFIAMTAGTSCTQAIQEAAQNGMKGKVKYLWQPSVCSASTFVGKAKVGGDGMATDGWWIVNGGAKDLNATDFDTDPFIIYARELLKKNGLDPKASGSYGSGYLFGWAMNQLLDTAAQLPGGLSRTNLITAARHYSGTNPMLYNGIGFNMNGGKDAYLIEGGLYQKYDGAKQVWVTDGSAIDLSGQSKPCVWDQSIGNCK